MSEPSDGTEVEDDGIEDGLTDEWDNAIARGIMRATWANAIGALLFGTLSYCCNPFFVLTFVSVGAGLNTVLRVRGMRPEFRAQISGGELVAAVIVAALGAVVGLLQPLLVAVLFAGGQVFEG